MKQELYRLYNGELSSILTADEGMMIVRNADKRGNTIQFHAQALINGK